MNTITEPRPGPTIRRQVVIGCCTLILGDCFEVLPTLTGINAIVTDPPFSERTHSGHNLQINNSNSIAGAQQRRSLNYEAWSDSDVERFCDVANIDGWLVVLTDHVLASAFEKSTNAIGRYTFAPLPSFTPGRSVRLCGDGPSSWTDWIMVSRTANQSKWGTLPGGYVNKPINRNGSMDTQMGGKPLSLMGALVRDYSREGDLVCDPCAGSGTTAIACYLNGRRCVAIEQNPIAFDRMVARVENELQQQQLL